MAYDLHPNKCMGNTVSNTFALTVARYVIATNLYSRTRTGHLDSS